MVIKYKVKEIALDPMDSLIVKTGDSVEFTLRNIESDIIFLEKNLKELKAKKGVEDATMKNIGGTHPHIAQMTKEDLTAAFLYRQSMGFVTQASEKITEIEAQLADYEKSKKEIEKQTGLK